MLAAIASGASHPVVAGLLGLGAAGLAGAVVAMAWSVHTRQIRLAEQLARRQFIVAAEASAPASANGNGHPKAVRQGGRGGRRRTGPASPVIIEGPDHRGRRGEQARYRVRPNGGRTVVSWAAGGGSVAQSTRPVPIPTSCSDPPTAPASC